MVKNKTCQLLKNLPKGFEFVLKHIWAYIYILQDCLSFYVLPCKNILIESYRMNNSKKLTINMHIWVFAKQPCLQSIREHILMKIMRTLIKWEPIKVYLVLIHQLMIIFPRTLAQRQLNKPWKDLHISISEQNCLCNYLFFLVKE